MAPDLGCCVGDSKDDDGCMMCRKDTEVERQGKSWWCIGALDAMMVGLDPCDEMRGVLRDIKRHIKDIEGFK